MKRCTYCGKTYPDEASLCGVDARPLRQVQEAAFSGALVFPIEIGFLAGGMGLAGPSADQAREHGPVLTLSKTGLTYRRVGPATFVTWNRVTRTELMASAENGGGSATIRLGLRNSGTMSLELQVAGLEKTPQQIHDLIRFAARSFRTSSVHHPDEKASESDDRGAATTSSHPRAGVRQTEPAPPPLRTVRRSSGHPVADNPIRLLADKGWTTPRDLAKAARKLKLLARDKPIEPTEPGQPFCPRLRAKEDYVAAEKEITDATRFAAAAAFVPDHWTTPVSEPSQANLMLLEAEHLAQGDGRKAELVNRVLQFWESEAGNRALQTACEQAGQFFNTPVDAAEVQRRFGQALCAVVEQVIADFGEAIEPSKIDLLNTLDTCRRVPGPRGAAAAGTAIFQSQLQCIDRYLREAFPQVGGNELSQQRFLSEAEVQSLLARCQEARQAFALLQRRPALLHRLPDDRLPQVSTVSAALAFRVGWHHHRWFDAAAFVAGSRPEHITEKLVPAPQARRLFMVSCHAIPLMPRVAQGLDMKSELEGLRQLLPQCGQEIDAFKTRAAEMLRRAPRAGAKPSGGHTLRELVAAVPQIVGKWLGGFLILILLAALRSCLSNSDRPRPSHSYEPPPNPPALAETPPYSPPVRLMPLAQPSSSASGAVDGSELSFRKAHLKELMEELKRRRQEVEQAEAEVRSSIRKDRTVVWEKRSARDRLVNEVMAELDAIKAAAKISKPSLTNGP